MTRQNQIQPEHYTTRKRFATINHMTSQKRNPHTKPRTKRHGGESTTSKHYNQGKTVGYGYRVQGPQSPIHTTRHHPTCPLLLSSGTCTCNSP